MTLGAVWPFFFDGGDQSAAPPTPYLAVHGDADTRVYPFCPAPPGR